jgi:hypothetical protein
VVVGRFRIEGEIKAGVMGPSPSAMKFSGTDDCRWAAGGFGVTCTRTTEDAGGMKVIGASLAYYDPTSKTYHFSDVDSLGGIDGTTGTVSGGTWTWIGESVFGGKVFRTRYIMKFVSKESYEYTVEGGESESSMTLIGSGKQTRVAAKPATSKPAQ